MHTLVALGDGAEWIWRHARAYLALPGVEVVESIDLSHAYEYLWAVGNAASGEGTAEAAAWVEPLKTRLYTEGASPLHASLTTLARTVCTPPFTAPERAAATAVRRALEYVTTNAARLDYPAFVARRFPLGSGAVESSCKSVVQARTKGAGMRWSAAGAQQWSTCAPSTVRGTGTPSGRASPNAPASAWFPASAACQRLSPYRMRPRRAPRPSWRHRHPRRSTRRRSRAYCARPPIIPGGGNPSDARGGPERAHPLFRGAPHPQQSEVLTINYAFYYRNCVWK